jgi:multiple sugar transport system ATP-binding protein
MAEVALEKVSRVFAGGTIAVDSLDLKVEDQELLVLVGPSGCGKSTTLRMIAGLEEISSGQITIDGKPVNDVAPRDRDIAMVFQNYALYPHMTVRKNMAFGLQLRYGSNLPTRLWHSIFSTAKTKRLAELRAEIPSRVTRAAETLGIGALLDRLPRQLSGGERQRVALGRAMVRQPAAFLFDEPLSNLDAKLRVEMRKEIKQLHRQLARTMIYVTHDQVEALTLGQRIAVMNNGRLQQVGPPMEVYDRPDNRFVAGFLGTPAMNFWEGRLGKENDRWTFCSGENRVELPAGQRFSQDWSGRAATLGIRPEDVVLDSESSLRAEVMLVESLGDASLVHVMLLGEGELPARLVAKAAARLEIEVGEHVALGMSGERIHLFDAATGDRLKS